MYQGSTNYFVSMFIARFGFLYGAGSAVNTGLQMFTITIGFMNRGPQTFEALPYFMEKWIFVMLPIHPPFTAVDLLSVLFNLLMAALIAASWTASWSQGMSAYHGR